MKKIDLFIVGQPKSGTTALANFLEQHPDICFARPKEPGFFAKDHIKTSDKLHGKQLYKKARTIEELEKHFVHHDNEKIFAEGTTTYLYSTDAAKNIQKYNPDAKIIIMLREPTEMLYSLHSQNLVNGDEDVLDFKTALELEPQRKKGKKVPKSNAVPELTFYSERIKYADHIKRYQKLFPKKNILIIEFNDFRKDNEKTYSKVINFLKLDKSFKPDFAIINDNNSPRFRPLFNILNDLRFKSVVYKIMGPRFYINARDFMEKLMTKRAKRKPMDEELRKELKNKFRPEVKKLSKLLGKNYEKIWKY